MRKDDTKNQFEKAVEFKELHLQNSAFVIPNPWDIASTKIMKQLGFKAVATSSAALAYSNGKADGSIPIEKVLIHLNEIVSSTSLPVNADLGNGFHDSPEKIYDTIIQAAQTGIVGASIEDVSHKETYSIEFAIERIQAASEAAKSLNFPFMLTARADNYFIGKPNLKDTITRLQAFQEAGTDVLFAPGITSKEELKSIIQSIDKPLNVLIGITNSELNYSILNDMGVKRVSLGANLYRIAMNSFIQSLKNFKENPNYDFSEQAIDAKVLIELMKII